MGLAVVGTHGTSGVLYDVTTGAVLRLLQRGDYHPEVSGWAIGFVQGAFVFAIDWNRLEVLELPSMKRLAPATDEMKLDYFYGTATVSPDRRRLASHGWHWHPIGGMRIIDVADWLSTRNEPSALELAHTDWWDAALCWLDDTYVVMRGAPVGEGDDAWFIEEVKGVLIVDINTGKSSRLLPGITEQKLGSDGERIFALGESTRVFDAQSGALLTELSEKCAGWHRGARTLLSISPHALTAVWLTGLLPASISLPAEANDENLVVLADALEETGAPQNAIAHCREGPPHGARCWVIEALWVEPSGRR